MANYEIKKCTIEHLKESCEGALPEFYGHYGFDKDKKVMLMSRDL